MKLTLCLAGLWLASVALADGPVCVSNYLKGGLNPCNVKPNEFAHVTPIVPRPFAVCTRVYRESFCEMAPREYVHIIDEDGRTICVLENNQPGVANMCEKPSDQFVWVKRDSSQPD